MVFSTMYAYLTTPRATTTVPPTTAKPKTKAEGLKPCCACPVTKTARDDCVILNGEENCADLIEAHKVCMREAGFDV
eukprot:m.150444 g.150444  ORF g.150444 m.150444 type:complete len:77 (-) comp30725_c2_seq1:1002-1232(-)